MGVLGWGKASHPRRITLPLFGVWRTLQGRWFSGREGEWSLSTVCGEGTRVLEEGGSVMDTAAGGLAEEEEKGALEKDIIDGSGKGSQRKGREMH